MNKSIYIEVPGQPIAKKRPKFARVGNGVKTYNPSETDEGRFLVSVYNQVGEAPRLTGPIVLNLTFIMQRPKSHFGTGRNAKNLKASAPKCHTVKPDKDNLEKFVMDSLNGYMWVDDCQVVDGRARKIYCDPEDVFGPRTLIKVFEIGG